MTKLTQADLDCLLNQTYYSWNTSVMLAGVIDFLKISESNLSWQRRSEIRKAQQEAAAVEFAPEDEYLASSYRRHLVEGAEYRFDAGLSQHVRYAGLVAFVTTLEWCAKGLRDRMTRAMTPKPDGENEHVHFFSILNQLSSAGFDGHIGDLRRLVQVRNCLVHAAGFVDGYKFGGDVRAAVTLLKGFSVSDQNFLGTTIHIEAGAIEDYAGAASQWVPRLDELCKSAGILN